MTGSLKSSRCQTEPMAADGVVLENSQGDADACMQVAGSSKDCSVPMKTMERHAAACGKKTKKHESTSALTAFMLEQTEKMDSQSQKLTDLKEKRKQASAEKRAATKEIKQHRKYLAKKDRVMGKRSTWSLVAELEKRMAKENAKMDSGHMADEAV